MKNRYNICARHRAKNDVFVNNSIDGAGQGGAIWDYDDSQVTNTNSLFTGNTATQQDGAIWEGGVGCRV